MQGWAVTLIPLNIKKYFLFTKTCAIFGTTIVQKVILRQKYFFAEYVSLNLTS